MSESAPNRQQESKIYPVLILLIILGFAVRVPGITGDFNGLHDWKNIRHFQLATSMLESRNPIYGVTNFTQPETNPKWWEYTTEAPWVDWSLMALFAVVKPSISAFQMLFIVIDTLTIALFFFIMRRIVRPWIALLGAFIYCFTPVCLYFASYSLGEAFLKWGLLVWVWAAHALLSGRDDWKAYSLYILACGNLALCKLTTGALFAFGGVLFLWIIFGFRIRKEIGTYPKRIRTMTLTFMVLSLIGIIGGFVVYFVILKKEWLTGGIPIFRADYYILLFERWKSFIGMTTITIDAVGAIYYAGRTITRFRGGPAFSAGEKTAATLMGLTLLQWMLQSQAYIPHEYYMSVFVVPAIVAMAVFLDRIASFRSRLPISIALIGMACIFGARLPTRSAMISYLYSVENVPEGDRAMLKQFFGLRTWQNKKQFIIVDQPRWGFQGGVNVDLVPDWDQLVALLHKDPKSIAFIKGLNDPYVLLARHSSLTNPERIKQLEEDLVIDLGQDYFKLGLVLRGESFFLYKITDGIASQTPIDPSLTSGKNDRFWIHSESAFKEAAFPDSPNDMFFSSSDDGHGAVFSIPFAANGDAIAYRMRGKGAEGVSVSIIRDGVSLYSTAPESDEWGSFAFDIGAIWGSQFMIDISDSFAWSGFHMDAGKFQIITYSSPFSAVPDPDGTK